MKRIGIVVQARMNSSRLPGKVIKPFYGDKGILYNLLSRIHTKFSNIPLILATSDRVADDVLQPIAMESGFSVFRGSEVDVLGRFVGVCETFGLNHVVRVCADNPFLNMAAIKESINKLSDSDLDYVCFCNAAGLPSIKTHSGIYAELVSFAALKRIQEKTNDELFLEHVTNYIYTNPDGFKIQRLEMHKSLSTREDIRLTVDSQSDFDIAANIYRCLHPEIDDIDNLIKLVDNDKVSHLKMINNILNNSK